VTVGSGESLVIVVVVAGLLNVAMIAELEPSAMLPAADGHGLVVPPQLAAVRLPDCPLQPVKVEPTSAAAAMRYVSLFLKSKVPDPLQVATAPEAVHDPVTLSGASPAPMRVNVTVPVPVPDLV
jgi:hypothetical protein